MKRLLIMSISVILLLIIIGILNKDNKEQKMIETAAHDESELKEMEQRSEDTNSLTNHFEKKYGDNFDSLIILENNLNINLFYPELSEELAQSISTEVLEYLQIEDMGYDVDISIKSEMVDEYGQTMEHYPFGLKVTNETLYKFNFDQFDINNLESTVDEYFYYN